jgi:hypothetical protein
VLLAACTTAKPPPPVAPDLSPAAILSLVRQREDHIVTMRARFAATTRIDTEERRADGVLLVHKPDHFRLRLLLPLGVTVFDYVSAAERVQMVLPLENRVINGEPQGNLAAFSRADLGQAFLRGPYAFPGRCEARPVAAEIVVQCGDEGSRREIHIDRATATIREETSFTGGVARLQLRFSDYRADGDTLLPYRIALSYPDRAMRVDIEVGRYEVNPALGAELFAPLAPWSGT